MNDMPGVVKFAAVLPATDRGKTIAVIADPAIVVPGREEISTVAAAPGMAWPSENRAAPPPAGCTLYMMVPGAALTNAGALSAGTAAHVGAAGTAPPAG